MSNSIFIVGMKLSPAQRDKLFDVEGRLKSPRVRRGQDPFRALPLSLPGLFRVRKGMEIYVGFVVLNTEGRAGQGCDVRTVHFEDDVVSLDQHPYRKKDGLARKLRTSLQAAQQRWDFFAAWARAQRTELGSGELLFLNVRDRSTQPPTPEAP